MPKLKLLSFGSNNIKAIDSEILKPLTMLKDLNLGKNQIKNLDLTFWQSIDMQHNQIEEIPAGAFENLTNLTQLNLNENKLKYFDAFELKLKSPIVEISLNKNQISKICFVGLKKLKILLMDRNNLTTIDNNMTETNVILETLSFSQNNVSEIEESFMKRQNVLKTFQYSRNPCVIPGPTANKEMMMENLSDCFKNFEAKLNK
jgi:Leucine-rich repeat (LRR) protein